MKYVLCCLLLLSSSFNATASLLHQRDIEDFHGNHLIIGLGNHSYFCGQRKINPDKEYSIDILKYVMPCRVANGLDFKTYLQMPTRRFSQIVFQNIGFSPIPSDLFYENGIWFCKKPDEELWDKSIQSSYPLPGQLLRILKYNGVLIYKTCILEDESFFKQLLISCDETGFDKGLGAWKQVYLTAGFRHIKFEKIYDENLKGWYIQMTARKPYSSKMELENLPYDRLF